MNTESFLQTLEQLDSYSHHVFLVFGDREKHESDIRVFLSEHKKIDLTHNPDIFFFNSPQLSISESRKIKQLVSMTNTVLDKKYVVISTDAITVEAQNALLKTIEDPDSPTVFFILLPEGSFVLETISSRSQIITVGSGQNHKSLVESYLKAGYTKRIELLEVFYTEGDEKKPKIHKGNTSLFLTELQNKLSQLVLDTAVAPDVYQDVQDVTQYLFDRSANTKQILEYISLRIPQVK